MHIASPRRRRAYSIARQVGELADRSRLALLASEPHAHAVREDTARYAAYETEGSERRALGSIGVSVDARWMATLTVPIPDDRVAFVHLERRGALPAGYRGGEESAAFSVPVDEVEALVAVLAGIVTQARRDGVLPDGAGGVGRS